MKILAVIFAALLIPAVAFAETDIKAAAGKEFTITLDSNRTTGYEWQLAKPLDENIVRLAKPEYIPASTKLCGAPGKEVWKFKAIKPGKTTIYFKYIRPWEKNPVPAKDKKFDINIL